MGSSKRSVLELDSLATGRAHDVCPAPAAARGLGAGWAEGPSNVTLAAWQSRTQSEKE